MPLVYIYYSLMLGCFVLSLFYWRYSLVRSLGALLLVSLITESIVEIMGKNTTDFFVVYHFFVPIEYCFITAILLRQVPVKSYRRLLLYSIGVFVLLSAYLSLLVVPLTSFPTIHGTIEGALVIAWCLLTLLSIEPVEDRAIYQLPVFWITLAFLVYFVGTLSINSVYNYLLATHSSKAKHFFSVFNSISNYLLYIFLSIGIISHKWKAKSSAPLSQSP